MKHCFLVEDFGRVGQFWQFLTNAGQFWLFVPIFIILDQFWPVWHILTRFDKLLPFLANLGRFAFFGFSWAISADFGHFVKFHHFFAFFCPSLVVLTSLANFGLFSLFNFHLLISTKVLMLVSWQFVINGMVQFWMTLMWI